jgi:tetratricopeptide (TPR) repeat protein
MTQVNEREGGPAAARAPLKVRPDDAFALAVALEEAGRVADAERLYRQILATLPGSAPVLHNLALIQRGQGQFAEAEANVRRAIAAEPANPSYQNSLGVILRAAGRLDDAEAAYRKAIATWPDYPEPHFNLGLLLEVAGRTDEALAELREAVRLKPDYAQAATRLSGLLQRLERAEEALGVLEAAAAAKPSSFELTYTRGTVLATLQRHAEAAEALQRASALRPDSLEAALALTNALRDAGRIDDALAACWRALELRPDRAATHSDLNRLAWMASRHDLYLKSFAYVREKRGPDPELLQLEAAFHLRGEKHAQAEALLREARTMAPGRGDVAGLLARALAGQGRFEESYPLFVEALNTEPRAMIHRIEFGFALLRDHQAGQALTVFEQALRVSPFDQLILAGLGLAYRELGDNRYHALMDFSRYVRVYELKPPRGTADVDRYNRSLAEELQGLHSARVEPIDQTLRGGTQTTGRLFDERLPAVQHLREGVEAAVQDYIGQVGTNAWHPVALRKPDAVKFQGSWSCWLRSGGFHQNHVHPQGWLSSAYYVRLPGAIEDTSAKAGWLRFGQSNLALGAADVSALEVRPAVGLLVLFPSYFWHGTVPFADGNDRLAVAFDVAGARGSLPSTAPDDDLSPMALR